jgi:hypothetical protein
MKPGISSSPCLESASIRVIRGSISPVSSAAVSASSPPLRSYSPAHQFARRSRPKNPREIAHFPVGALTQPCYVVPCRSSCRLSTSLDKWTPLWRRAHNTSGPSDGVGASNTRRCETSDGQFARRRTPGGPGVSPSVAEGHARQQRWRGHRTDARKAHERRAPSGATEENRRKRGAHRPPVWPASAGRAHRTLRSRTTRQQGQDGDDPKPERGKAQGGIGPSALHEHAGVARTARGDKAQEPRPVTRGRIGLASTPVGGRPADDPTGQTHLTTRRGAVIGETAGGLGRRRRRDTRGREQRREGRKPQERRRCSRYAGCIGQAVRRLARVAEHRP